MPLLKRKAFEKSTASEYLRDDDEVFHCEITDEIFKDYEEYCERIILVNSMVWTCEMTGKNNLTYAEALESEKAARRLLKDFPMELRIPILYLAVQTKRCSFAEMSEDIFNFVRERFFVGETVEACLEGDLWREAHVLSVTAQKQQPGSKATLPATAYCYEVEQFEETDPARAGQIGTAPPDRVRRRKGVYSRDKNRLFLKQFVQQQAGGIIGIKKAALDKYNISKVHFDQIFTGSPPEFPSSKKLMKSPAASKSQAKPTSASKQNKSAKKPSPDKKGRQESMDKFVKKTEKSEVKAKPPIDPAAKKNAQELAEKMRRAEDQMRQRKEEEKAKKKEKTARLQAYLKEWQKVKDDLELEDHKIIPKGTPVEIEGIPQKHIGDFLSVLSFVHLYSDVLKTKDTFHNSLELETFRAALTQKEHAGAFSDLIQMLLTTIFALQEDEAEEYNEAGRIQESTEVKEMNEEIGTMQAIELATKASKWSQTYLATPLSKLPLDPTTVSEVLRLHLLSSGAAPGSRCATWRYHQRGGYSSVDDPGLRLRVTQPRLLRSLHAAHVADLALDDKFLILQCLMNQILSYATVRDIIEEKLEELKNNKHALRTLTINEIKKEAAAMKEEQKLTGEKAKAVDEDAKAAIEKLHKENEAKRLEYQKKVKELQLEIFESVTYLGSDRAFRRYWVNQRIPGLFVEAGADVEALGPCRDKPVPPAPPRTGGTIEYVTKLFETERVFEQIVDLVDCLNLLESLLGDQRIPGLFVEAGADVEALGPCRDKPVPPAPPRTGGTIEYVTKLFETERGSPMVLVSRLPAALLAEHVAASSDKENDSGANSRGNSPKKPLSSLNGLNHKLNNGFESNTQQLSELLVCTGDINTCCVHGKSDRPNWSVYHTEEQIEALIQSLNKRGLRESELRQALEQDKDSIVASVAKCPLHQLNPSFTPVQPPPVHHTRHKKVQVSLTVPPDCSLSEALELSLRDHILELEEKIFHGCLGALKVKDREAWRGTIMVRGYDKQADYLTWGPKQQYRDDYHLPNGVLNVPTDNDNEENPIVENKYRDPGHYLETPKTNGIKSEPEAALAKPDVVRGLACALLQVEQAIHHKYIKRPLGLDDKDRKEREAKNKPLDLEALERWEVSLMECRSFAQIVLHLFTLDSSVSWAASILNASCRLCRRKADPDNMLLCDGCNKGHHLYCLKPKLTKVPEGDWFCEQCRPKERTPRKRRKLFSDEEMEQVLNNSSDSESLSLDGGVCGACGSGGLLSCACNTCGTRYHPECAQPRPGRAAKRWTCQACLHPTRESDDSEYNTALVKFKSRNSRNSKESSPLLNGSATKRGRKSKEEHHSHSSRKSKSSLTNGHEERSTGKKRSSKVEVHLHTEALEQLIKEVMKHKDVWPFFEPVSTEDVPDYLDVIEQPMDFSTIKAKLEAGEYSRDEELISDVSLVFLNCYTYNKDTHPVAKSGARLEKYINKRCSELELPPLPELELERDDESDDVPLKRRASSPPAPSSKRARHK